MIPARRPILLLAAGLTVFWVLTIAVAVLKSRPDGGMSDSGIASIVATIVFFFFTLPAFLFAYINQWLVFAAVLAGTALVIDTGMLFFWIGN